MRGQPRRKLLLGLAGEVDQDYPGQPPPAAGFGTFGEVDQVVTALASRQGGVVSRDQLRTLGLSRGTVEHRLATGRYVAVHRGVYTIAGAPLGMRGRSHAALLAGGSEAVLSHRSAAAQWAMRPETSPPEITVPGGRRRSRADLVIHTRPPFASGDVAVRDGLRLTSPVRTLLDLAGVEPAAALERAVAEAQVLGLVAPGELERAAARAPRRWGAARLLAALHGKDAAPTRSELERAMLRLIADAGLPSPQVAVPIESHMADFCWPEHRLIVETDGWHAHGNRRAFERDRARDVVHQAAGWTVTRFTWRQVTERPLWVAAQLARLLARAPTEEAAACAGRR